MGNQESSIIITTWISPYCPHCANIVTDILSLYDKTNGNIQWRIYWAGKADKHSYYNKVQLHLIAIYKEDKQKFMLAIKNGISIIRPLYLQLKVIIDYLLAV